MFVISFLLTGFISAVVVACYVMLFSFTLWMVIDAGKQDRFWWMTIILIVPIVGPGAYYLTEKKHEYAHAPNHHVHNSETEDQHEKSPEKKKRVKKVKEEVFVVQEAKKEESTEEKKAKENS